MVRKLTGGERQGVIDRKLGSLSEKQGRSCCGFGSATGLWSRLGERGSSFCSTRPDERSVVPGRRRRVLGSDLYGREEPGKQQLPEGQSVAAGYWPRRREDAPDRLRFVWNTLRQQVDLVNKPGLNWERPAQVRNNTARSEIQKPKFSTSGCETAGLSHCLTGASRVGSRFGKVLWLPSWSATSKWIGEKLRLHPIMGPC